MMHYRGALYLGHMELVACCEKLDQLREMLPPGLEELHGKRLRTARTLWLRLFDAHHYLVHRRNCLYRRMVTVPA